MTPAERTPPARLAALNARRLAAWLADRFRHVRRSLRWHAVRVRMQLLGISGRLGRLPPGPLAASCTREAQTDDRFYFRGFGLHGPIFKLFWGPANLKICVRGLPLARRLLNSHRGSLHPATVDITALVPGEYLRTMDPAVHPHYRRIFKGAFRDEVVTASEADIRGIIRRELGGLAGGADADLPAAARLVAALNRISTRSLLRVVMGLPPEAGLVRRLESLFARLGPDGYVADIGPEQRAAFPLIREHVLQMLQSMSRGDGGEFGDSVLRRLAPDAAGTAPDDAVIGNVIYLVERGRHDIRDLLRWVVKYLSDNPTVRADLRARGVQQGAEPGLAEACVLETLRLDQVENLNRKVLESFEFDGYRIPKGSWVSIMMRESHGDPQVFAEPERYRPCRFQERGFSLDEYAPFGIDEHQCIARTMVRRLGTMFVEELIGGYTWSVIGDGPRHFGHFHWQPSPDFAIALQPVPSSA